MTLESYWRLVRDNRNFRRLWLAQIVSEMGDWFYIVAIYSLLLQFTGKAQSLGLALVLQVLPSTLVGPTAGVINDRIRRKYVMIAADLARIVIVLGMMLVRSAEMVWLVYPLLFLETVMWGFFEPARSAVLPNIVGEDQLATANTVSSMTWSFNFAVSSAIGGLVTVLLGRNAVFILNAFSFLCSALLIRGMDFREPHASDTAPFRLRELVDFSPIAEGVRYIRRDARLLATVLLKGGIGLLGANWVIFPIMGERVFPLRLAGIDTARAAVIGMSLLMGARGIGALIGPFTATQWAGGSDSRMRRGILIAFSAAGPVTSFSLRRPSSRWLAFLSRSRIAALLSSGSSPQPFFSASLTINSAAASSPPTSDSSCSWLPSAATPRASPSTMASAFEPSHCAPGS